MNLDQFTSEIATRDVMLFSIFFRKPLKGEIHRNGGFEYPYCINIMQLRYVGSKSRFMRIKTTQSLCLDVFDNDVLPANSVIPLVAYQMSLPMEKPCTFLFNSQMAKDYLLFAIDYAKGVFYIKPETLAEFRKAKSLELLLNEYDDLYVQHLIRNNINHDSKILSDEKKFAILNQLVTNYQRHNFSSLINQVLLGQNHTEIQIMNDYFSMINPELALIENLFPLRNNKSDR